MKLVFWNIFIVVAYLVVVVLTINYAKGGSIFPAEPPGLQKMLDYSDKVKEVCIKGNVYYLYYPSGGELALTPKFYNNGVGSFVPRCTDATR